MNGSLGRRIAIAVALLVGFYVFAILIGGALLALAILQWTTDLPQNVWLTVACLVSAYAIFSSIVPRRAPFEPPGPQIDEGRAPRLFQMVRETAASLDQPEPDEIYLAHDANAAVGQRGGLLGRGGRRFMIVGLPLLDSLTVAELRAVLAHEFAHYYGGDTKLGPIFFRTYDAIARTVTKLDENDSIWRHPFRWYGLFFLRRNAAIRRGEEFAADRNAARVAGGDNLASALRTLSGAAPSWNAYMSTEFLPAIEGERIPPLVDGFHQFRAEQQVQEAEQRALDGELAATTEPYDTHPSLGERLHALGVPADTPPPRADDARAITLLDDPGTSETEVVQSLVTPEWWPKLRRIDWDAVPEEVLVPAWQASVNEHAAVLTGYTATGVAAAIADSDELFRRLFPNATGVPEDEHRRGVASVFGVALAAALHDAGWTVSAPPGARVTFERDGERIEALRLIDELRSGELAPADWREMCARLGIDSLPLVPGAREAAPA
jgi:heat shock protein HtpX